MSGIDGNLRGALVVCQAFLIKLIVDGDSSNAIAWVSFTGGVPWTWRSHFLSNEINMSSSLIQVEFNHVIKSVNCQAKQGVARCSCFYAFTITIQVK